MFLKFLNFALVVWTRQGERCRVKWKRENKRRPIPSTQRSVHVLTHRERHKHTHTNTHACTHAMAFTAATANSVRLLGGAGGRPFLEE